MARALENPFTVTFRQSYSSEAPGSDIGNEVCKCTFRVVDGDLAEQQKGFHSATLDLTQQVDVVCAAAVAAVKADEGI